MYMLIFLAVTVREKLIAFEKNLQFRKNSQTLPWQQQPVALIH